MRDKIGKFIALGIGEGIASETDSVVGEVENQGSAILNAYSRLKGAVGGFFDMSGSVGGSLAFAGAGLGTVNNNYNTYNQQTGTYKFVAEIDGETVYQTNKKYEEIHGENLTRTK